VFDNPIMKEFGVTINKNMKLLKGTRVLAPPDLQYGKCTTANNQNGRGIVTPERGTWEMWYAL
jgi:hypothetical protein